MSKITKSARNKECQLRLPGVCSNDDSTVVCCHIRIPGLCGVGCKPSDLLTFRACYQCHMVADGHEKPPESIPEDTMARYVLEAHCRTLVAYENEGLVKV